MGRSRSPSLMLGREGKTTPRSRAIHARRAEDAVAARVRRNVRPAIDGVARESDGPGVVFSMTCRRLSSPWPRSCRGGGRRVGVLVALREATSELGASNRRRWPMEKAPVASALTATMATILSLPFTPWSQFLCPLTKSLSSSSSPVWKQVYGAFVLVVGVVLTPSDFHAGRRP